MTTFVTSSLRNWTAGLLLLGGAASTPLLAADKHPNLYELKGDRLRISYSTTGFDGKPHFTYQNGRQTLSFAGKDIRTVETEIGTLVTVTTQQTVDRGSTTFTVLIPNVNLGDSRKAAIRTEGTFTEHKFSLAPRLDVGQTQTYSPVFLRGTASSVVF